jgi:hypothetical protein
VEHPIGTLPGLHGAHGGTTGRGGGENPSERGLPEASSSSRIGGLGDGFRRGTGGAGAGTSGCWPPPGYESGRCGAGLAPLLRRWRQREAGARTDDGTGWVGRSGCGARNPRRRRRLRWWEARRRRGGVGGEEEAGLRSLTMDRGRGKRE